MKYLYLMYIILILSSFVTADWVSTPIRYVVKPPPPSFTFINLTITTNQTYFDIGEYVYLTINETKNSTIDEIWLYSSDGTYYKFNYLVTKNYWYVQYKVKQSQELLAVQSFTQTKELSGYGQLILKINPNTITSSTWNLLLVNLGFLGASGIIIVIMIIVIIIILIFVKMFVVDKLTPRPLAPLNPGRTSIIGKVGSASMSGFEGIRNSVGFIFQLFFMIVTIVVIISIILVGLYILKLLHVL